MGRALRRTSLGDRARGSRRPWHSIPGLESLETRRLLSGGTFAYSNYTRLVIPNAEVVRADGINDSGQVVGTSEDAGNTHEIYGGLVAGPGSPDTLSSGVVANATGINNHGQIVGNTRGRFVILYDEHGQGVPTFIGDGILYSLEGERSGAEPTLLDFPGAIDTRPRGISDAGQVVGTYRTGTPEAGYQDHSFLWSGGQFTTIAFPGAVVTEANGINTSGEIVGTYGDATGAHGFLLSGGNYRTLDFPGAVVTKPYGINDNGQVVGTFSDVTGNGNFLLSDGLYTRMDFQRNPADELPPGATFSIEVHGINDIGQVVGLYSDYGGPGGTSQQHGFIADPVALAIKIDGVDVVGPHSSVAFDYETIGDTGPFSVALEYSPTPTYDPATAVPVLDPRSGRPVSQGVIPDAPGQPRTGGVFTFLEPPANPAGLPYLLAVADPSNLVTAADPDKAAAVRLPDLAVLDPTWDSSDQGVDLEYLITGHNLPEPTTVALYWAGGTTLDTAIGDPFYLAPTETATGSHDLHVEPSRLGSIPEGAHDLLAVVNPTDGAHPNGLALETTRANNVAALGLPDLAPKELELDYDRTLLAQASLLTLKGVLNLKRESSDLDLKGTVRVANLGAAPTGASEVVIFSTEGAKYDPAHDATYQELLRVPVDSISPGQTQVVRLDHVKNPLSISNPDGSPFYTNGYRFFAYIDTGTSPTDPIGDVFEISKANNLTGPLDPRDALMPALKAILNGAATLYDAAFGAAHSLAVSTAGTALLHYLDNTGTPLTFGPHTSEQVAEDDKFLVSRTNAESYVRKHLAPSALGSRVSLTIPPDVIGTPALGEGGVVPLSDQFDLKIGIHGTQGSSGEFTGTAVAYAGSGADRLLTYEGSIRITLTDRFGFDDTDLLDGGLNVIGRALEAFELARSFGDSMVVDVPITIKIHAPEPISNNPPAVPNITNPSPSPSDAKPSPAAGGTGPATSPITETVPRPSGRAARLTQLYRNKFHRDPYPAGLVDLLGHSSRVARLTQLYRNKFHRDPYPVGIVGSPPRLGG